MGVAKLTPAISKPDEKAIELLEAALEDAKAGKLRDVVITAGYENAKFFHSASFNDGEKLLGYLAAQSYIVASLLIDNADPVVR